MPRSPPGGPGPPLHQTYDGPYAELIRHSGRVLQALTYAPSGAMVAAPTTSLPESIGGERNWDYRFCWVRDASLTIEALWVAACPHEAAEFFDVHRERGRRPVLARHGLQIMYGVGGERLSPSTSSTPRRVTAAAAPVRIGNGAWDQTQLDVYGELLDAAARTGRSGRRFDPVTAQFLATSPTPPRTRWTDPDQGIWEIRGAPATSSTRS